MSVAQRTQYLADGGGEIGGTAPRTAETGTAYDPGGGSVPPLRGLVNGGLGASRAGGGGATGPLGRCGVEVGGTPS